MAKRLPTLFASIAKKKEPIDVVSSGQGRAIDSANLYGAALAQTDPDLTSLIGTTRTDKDLLYFHKADGGAAYRAYIANDQRLATTLKTLTDQPKTHRAARDVLKKLFTLKRSWTGSRRASSRRSAPTSRPPPPSTTCTPSPPR